MACDLAPFEEPVFVTRPLLPPFEEYCRELEPVWSSRQLTNRGPCLVALERELAAHLGVSNVSLFSSGTTALFAGIRSLGLQGEVITTPLTFPATVHALALNGIDPVFCDVDPVTLNLDPGLAEGLIGPRTTAILGVHLYGTPCDVDGIDALAAKRGLKVIYDAAHAFGVRIRGRGIGCFGDLTMFSFHATKSFHTAEGGGLTYREAALRPALALQSDSGIAGEESVLLPALNAKMSELQAALGRVVLRHVEEERAARRTLVDAYRRLLAPVEGVTLLPEIAGVEPAHQYFPVRIDPERFGCDRDEVCGRFRPLNVFPRKYFHPACCDYPCYAQLPSARPGLLPVAREASRQVLCLPLYGSLPLDAVARICGMLLSFRGRGAR